MQCSKIINNKLKDFLIITEGFIGLKKNRVTKIFAREDSDYGAVFITEAI